jgi:soluble lytic murein transglycosylase-like protein
MPHTARRFAVKNSFNPSENIDGGVRYLKYLLTLFGDQQAPETLALAAYNAGEGAVIRHGGVPPYRETTQYVRKVEKKWVEAQAAAGVARTIQEAAVLPVIEQFVDSRGVLHIQTRPSP